MDLRHASIWLTLVLTIPQASPAPAVDVSVKSLEITQGFQTMATASLPGTMDNKVKLVAYRSVVVRATLDLNGGTTPLSVQGTLQLMVPGKPTSTFTKTFTAPPNPQRENENDTLNFYIPGVEPSVPGMFPTFVMSITAPGDTNPANDSLSVSREFVAPQVPRIFYTPIIYPTVSTLAPDPLLIKKTVGEAMVQGIFPLDDTRSDLYNPGPFPFLTFNDQWGLSNTIDGIDDLLPVGKDVDKLLSLLESCRLLIVASGAGPTDKVFLYGWLRDNPIASNGWAAGCVGFGNTELVRFQRTFAHEFMHMCRQNAHITDTLDHVGWDIGPYMPANPAGNNVPVPAPPLLGAVKPTSLYDITTPNKLTHQAWIDHGTFEWFMPHLYGFSCAPGTTSSIDDSSELALNIQGSFSTDGNTLVELEPAFRFPWLVTTYPEEAEGPYRAEVTNNLGQVVTRGFDALLGHDGDDSVVGEAVRGFFSVSVPVVGTADLLRIMDATGATEYGRLERSQAAPALTITSPMEGTQLADIEPILWDPMDTDTSVSNLVYQVAYSPDNGASFVPVAVDLRMSEAVLETSMVPQTNAAGTGLIRVFVSDGLNTTYADVAGLTVAGIPPPFVRGDIDGNGSIDISDPIFLFGYLFLGSAEPPCRTATDSNSDGNVNISDGAYTLNYLFLGGSAPAAPFPRCDRSESALILGCSTAPTCP